MKLLKLTLPLTLAGLLAGLGVSFLVTPRYVATGVVALTNQASEALAPEILRRMRQDFELDLSAQAGEAVHVKPLDQSNSTFLIQATDSDRRGATGLANAVITGLIQRHNSKIADLIKADSEQRDKAVEARIAELQTRLATLEARVGVSLHKDLAPAVPLGPWNGHVRLPVELRVLDPPVVRMEFPNRAMFAFSGGLMGLIGSFFLRRRV